jgi:zinc/manganese transport system substrate-binding protein
MAKSLLLAGAAIGWTMLAQTAVADPVAVVAAENFYGDIAAEIGGVNVAVTNIQTDPDGDPRLLGASAATARALSEAKIVIVNGADDDPWMEKLLAANNAPGRREIRVASLVHENSSDNPPLWSNPATVRALANALTIDFGIVDPAHRMEYQRAGTAFLAGLEPLDAKIAAMRGKYAESSVVALEPAFGAMADLLGLKVHNERFASSAMKAEPNSADLADLESDLEGHKVKLMLYNAQASDPAVQRLLQIARQEKIPVVGVSEAKPANMTYQEWIIEQLEAIDRALASSAF